MGVVVGLLVILIVGQTIGGTEYGFGLVGRAVGVARNAITGGVHRIQASVAARNRVAVSHDDAAIYGVIVDHLWRAGHGDIHVVALTSGGSTLTNAPAKLEAHNSCVPDSSIPEQLMRSFARRNVWSTGEVGDIPTPHPYELVQPGAISALPRLYNVVRFSLVAYDGEFALVYAGQRCGNMCADASFYGLIRDDTGWRLVTKCLQWMS